MKRPVSLTIVAWYFIVSSVLGAAGTFYMRENLAAVMAANHLPVPVQFGIAIVGLTLVFISGIGILKGFNWARILYVVTTLAVIVIGFATAAQPAIYASQVVLFLIISFFLFRKPANAYFKGSPAIN